MRPGRRWRIFRGRGFRLPTRPGHADHLPRGHLVAGIVLLSRHLSSTFTQLIRCIQLRPIESVRLVFLYGAGWTCM